MRQQTFFDEEFDADMRAKHEGTTAQPFVRDSATSEAAAREIEPVATSLEAKVLAHIRAANDATCDECEVALSMSHQTCSARIRGLAKKGLIYDSGATRRTRSGRKATVWRAKRDRVSTGS